MKFNILSMLLTFLMVSCSYVNDGDGMVPEIKYFYVNKSETIVTITVANKIITANVADSVIKVGDTIQFWDYTFNNAVTGPFGSPEETTEIKLIFEDPLKKCLLYSGPLDTVNDIRSRTSYNEDSWVSNKVNRYFTITNEHYEKATECP